VGRAHRWGQEEELFAAGTTDGGRIVGDAAKGDLDPATLLLRELSVVLGRRIRDKSDLDEKCAADC
jgi:hypothetical protein